MVSLVPIPSPHPQLPVQHQYGTRIRSNSVIRPSARLRQSPTPPVVPRRIKPVPAPKSKLVPVAADAPRPDFPPFPPEHIMLHSDDANSKVFLAIGRSFMSVDNRAMTIKDLAEMTIKYGLMCQNVSAAGQAITTYIRNHLQRCEAQEDHPLLLRHVLSGTASDDDLVPALHSRVGGAHCALSPSDNRVTNFRRGTMVWYLSKAAGAPCPFARAGIRLCDYTENGKIGSVLNDGRERKRERDRLRRAERCGQKRKRLLRACADKGSDSDSTSEEEKRPAKVKLTLRLRPPTASASFPSSAASAQSDLAQGTQRLEIIDLSKDDSESDSDSSSGSDSDSDSDSDMNSDSDSMSIESSSTSDAAGEVPGNGATDSQHVNNGLYATHQAGSSVASYRRSPSVPCSVTSASPPPDSEEDEDFHIAMTGFRRYFPRDHDSSGDDDDDEMSFDGDLLDFDGDAETQWESPGPRSPSAQFEDEDVVVKQEASDVGGLLDAWDDLEHKTEDMKVVEYVAQAAGLSANLRPKLEEMDSWLFHNFGCVSSDFVASPMDDGAYVKQEEVDYGVPFSVEDLFTPPPECRSSLTPVSPLSSPVPTTPFSEDFLADRRNSDFEWRDAELLGPDSVKLRDLDEGFWSETKSVCTSQRAVQTEPESSPAAGAGVASAGPESIRVGLPPRLDLEGPEPPKWQARVPPDLTSPTLLTSLTSLSIRTPTLQEARTQNPFSSSTLPMHAQESLQQRRAVTVQRDETSVVHTCQPCDPAITATQLEGVIVYQMTFGSSLTLRKADSDFVNVSPLIKELAVSQPESSHAVTVSEGSPAVCGFWVPLPAAQDAFKDSAKLAVFLSDQLAEYFPPSLRDHLQDVLSLNRSRNDFGQHFQSTMDRSHQDVFEFLSAALPIPATSSEELALAETPLSPTEEAMFRVLCSDHEWETLPTDAVAGDAEERVEVLGDATPMKDKDSGRHERPLRRSKRVADAIANRSRTRSSKRGSRSSLS